MPTVRRPRVRAWAGPPIADAAKAYLLRGERTARGAEGFGDYAQARYFGAKLWKRHGAALLAEFIVDHPGERPTGWWEHQCPQRAMRQKVGGSGEEGAPVSLERVRSCHGCDPSDPPMVESVPAFLRRLNLLLAGEEQRIPRRAFQPVALEVDAEGWVASPYGCGVRYLAGSLRKWPGGTETAPCSSS
jgi:hypothetical protein